MKCSKDGCKSDAVAMIEDDMVVNFTALGNIHQRFYFALCKKHYNEFRKK